MSGKGSSLEATGSPVSKARELLAAATPRPWGTVPPHACANLMTCTRPNPFMTRTMEDHTLIVAAVNEYEALLDIAEAAAGLSNHIQRGREPAGSLAGVQQWQAEQAPLEDALAVALTRRALLAPKDSAPHGETPDG